MARHPVDKDTLERMPPVARRAIESAARIILTIEFKGQGGLCPICHWRPSHLPNCIVAAFLEEYGKPALGLSKVKPTSDDEEWDWPELDEEEL